MGGLKSKPKKTDAEVLIEKQLAKGKKDEESITKLLLLGAGESGKSTIAKQAVNLYNKELSAQNNKDSMDSFISSIQKNLIQGMATLVEQSDLLKATLPDCEASDAVKSSREFFINLGVKSEADDRKLTHEVADNIKKLWADKGIKTTFSHRAKFQCPDSVAYFFDNLDRVTSAGYVPTIDDILRVRARTTGIVENAFSIQENKFKLIDVGGQRSERKKWKNCFTDVTAVLFVVAVSEFDHVLFEDGNTNRIHESLNLFHEMLNDSVFTNTTFILFLNKSDLFREKIGTSSIKVAFPDFEGDSTNYDQCISFIKAKFKSCQKKHKGALFMHVTCATDSSNINYTFSAVKATVIEASIRSSGIA